MPGSGQEGVDDVGLDVPDLQEFVEDFEQHRQQVGRPARQQHTACSHQRDTWRFAPRHELVALLLPCVQVVEGLAARYRSVGPLLVKVEELVAGTASGKSPRLAG